MSDAFLYLAEWQVLLCQVCGYCLRPGRDYWLRHLRQAPHGFNGEQLKALVKLFSSYSLRAADELQLVRLPTYAIPGLRLLDGFQCCSCSAALTTSEKSIQRHVSKAHQQKPGQQVEGSSWRECKLQTFFAETQYISYFVVKERENDAANDDINDLTSTAALDSSEQDFFKLLDADMAVADKDAKKEANVVHGFESHPSAVVTWLRRTGIEEHTRGLHKDEMQASFTVPKNADSEPELYLILEAMDDVLAEAHSWCFDGPDCMLTWPRQLALGRFYTAVVPGQKARAFDPNKAPSTLQANFGYWKQLLTYCYRVVYRDGGGGYFSRESEDQRTPENSIKLTDAQKNAWDAALQSATHQNRPALKATLSILSMMLICHEFGGNRYSSPLISFCAMLSINPFTKAWKEPGNYNSCLSGLIWVAQLVVFHASASLEKQGFGGTLELLEQYCENFLRPDTETPLGEILSWRLLLFSVSKETMSQHQAHWDADEERLTYGDIDLHMDQVPQLLLLEFQQAQYLLYDELLFGAQHLPRMRAWALKDNLDADAVNWCFHQHQENAGLLKPLTTSLRTLIQNSKPLRDSFLKTAANGTKVWRTTAIKHYEAVADEFLQRLLVLIHMSSGQPLRQSELFSITWRNTQRRRNVYLKHGLVMLHTTYHKGQQQPGKFKDNIRFLPAAIGDLLLNYLTYVVQLRQVFLRQSVPHAVISPYLWWKDGHVWTENQLTQCMEHACTRAKIPRLHIANWRQMTFSIVNTKFAANLSCFEVNDVADDEDAEDIDADIQAITQQRNRSMRTANRAYANQQNANFGNVWDGLIRRNLRASTLWKDLWGLDKLFEPT